MPNLLELFARGQLPGVPFRQAQFPQSPIQAQPLGPSAQRQPPPPQGPSGIAALLQTPGLQQALLQTGAALLAQKDQPGSLGGALGRALPSGIAAFQQGRQDAQLQEAISQLPPDAQQLLAGLPPELQQQVLASRLGRRNVPAGSIDIDPLTGTATRAPFAPGKPLTGLDILGQDVTDEIAAQFGPEATLNPTQEQVASAQEAIQQRDLDQALAIARAERGDDEFTREVRTGQARRLNEVIAVAPQRRANNLAINSVAPLLEEGRAFTGAFSDIALGVTKVANAFGITDSPRAAETERLFNVANTAALDTLQKFAGQISEMELKLALQLGGTMDLENMTIREIFTATQLVNNEHIRLTRARIMREVSDPDARANLLAEVGTETAISFPEIAETLRVRMESVVIPDDVRAQFMSLEELAGRRPGG